MLPTITPVGMAALLPGASATSRSSRARGSSALRSSRRSCLDFTDRLRFLKAKVPDVVDLPLDKLLRMSASEAREQRSAMRRSSSFGRRRSTSRASSTPAVRASRHGHRRSANIARAARKLASRRRRVVRGHAQTTGTSSRRARRRTCGSTSPGGDTVGLHRRCWIGRGGATPPGTIRVSAAELGYDSDLDFVFPKGLGVFKSGGGSRVPPRGNRACRRWSCRCVTFRIPATPSRPRRGERRSSRGRARRDHEPRVQRSPHARSAHDGAAALPCRPAVGRRAGRRGRDGRRRRLRSRHRNRRRMQPGTEASVGVMLTPRGLRRACGSSFRIPATDAVLGQSDEIPVRLGI